MTDKWNALISVLDINITEMARSLNYDASYNSRIRTGQRRPADMMGCEVNDIGEDHIFLSMLEGWLSVGSSEKKDSVSDFL